MLVLTFMTGIIGVILGVGLTLLYFRHKYVGTLRIDNSDPSDGAYFFLEIKSGKAGSIPNQKTILLKVNTQNYISHG